MFQAGIVGCGGIAQVHGAALANIDGVTLAACADIVPEKAARYGEKFGCRAYASLEEMLEKERLGAVHICTPHYLHAPMALKIAEQGAAVFTEKPPAMNAEQMALLEKAAARVPLGVCFQNRYNPNFREARRLIREGTYGKPVGARAFVTWSRSASYYLDSGWRGKWATEGGGALINQAIHTLDQLIVLLGPADRVDCSMTNRHLAGVIEVEDTVDAYMTMGGVPCLFYATTAYSGDAPVFLEVQLEGATLRLTEETLTVIAGGETETQSFPMPPALGKSYWGAGHQACIGDFYDCLREKHPYGNDLASVRPTMEAMFAMYRQNAH